MSGAPVGNENAAKGRRWRDALNKALARYANPETQVVAGQALDRIAEQVVMRALAGDWDSITEIATRLDGKPAQAVMLAGDTENPVTFNHTVEFIGASTVTPEA